MFYNFPGGAHIRVHWKDCKSDMVGFASGLKSSRVYARLRVCVSARASTNAMRHASARSPKGISGSGKGEGDTVRMKIQSD